MHTDTLSYGKMLTIQNVRGLHARSAVKVVSLVEDYEAVVMFSRHEITVPAASLMGLILLAAGKGAQVYVSAIGPDAVRVIEAIEQLIENKFEEGE